MRCMCRANNRGKGGQSKPWITFGTVYGRIRTEHFPCLSSTGDETVPHPYPFKVFFDALSADLGDPYMLRCRGHVYASDIIQSALTCNNALFPFYFRKPELRTCRQDNEDPKPGFEQF
jgi:hypothetical protein